MSSNCVGKSWQPSVQSASCVSVMGRWYKIREAEGVGKLVHFFEVDGRAWGCPR